MKKKDTSRKIDLKRYRKVRLFFVKVLGQVICWDIIFNNPILKWFRPDPLPRWQAVARQYKEMAMEMGGVTRALFTSSLQDALVCFLSSWGWHPRLYKH